MNIDALTLSITLIIANLLQVVALTGLAWVNQSRPGVGWWAPGMGAITLGFVTYALLQQRILGTVVIFANNIFFLAGMTAIYVGIVRFFGGREQRGFLIAFWASFLLALVALSYGLDSLAARRMLFSFSVALFSGLIAWTLWRNKGSLVPSASSFLALVFLINGVFFSLRGFEPLVYSLDAAMLQLSPMETVTYLLSLGTTTLWTFGFILLVNQQLHSESREARENLEAIFNARFDAVIITQLEGGHVVKLNEGFTLLTGFTPEDVIGKNAAVIKIWKNPEDRYPMLDLMRTQGFCQDIEVDFLRKDGTELTAMVSVKVISLQGVPHMITVMHDITERKRIEQALRQSEARYRLISENTQDVIWLMDPLSGRFTYVSPSVQKLRGYTPEEIMAEPVTAALTEESRRVVEEELRQHLSAFLALTEGTIARINEIDQPHKDGHIIHTEVITTYVWNEQREVEILGVTRDVTERKQTEMTLRETNAYLENLINYANAPIIVWDPQFRITRFNRAFEHLTGWREAEVKDQLLKLLFPPELAEQSMTLIHKTLTGERWETVEIKIQHRDGSVRTVLWNSATLFEADGVTPLATIAQGQDITGRKRVEEALLVAKQQAEAANHAKSVFLANMSHELRTPLNAILGFSQLMARDPNLTPAQHENLDTINRSGEHLLHIINDVLDMAKIEAGRHTFLAGPVDLQRLLDDLRILFRLRAESKGLALNIEAAPTVPPWVTTDEAKLRQILINLLGNAIKFTTVGQVALRVRAEILPVPQLIFEVQDTGTGIEPDDLESIFNPFIQSSMPDRMREGTGLGLTISYEFAQLLDGSLVAASRGIPGEGSVFTLTLPLQVESSATGQLAPLPSYARAIGLEPGQPNYRMLVADDRPENARLLVTLLQQLGFEAEGVPNGAEAVERWRTWQPHVVWMDLRMPVMDGIDATHHILRACDDDPALLRPVIIALSASVFGEAQAHILASGCDAFIAKPFREHEIVLKLEQYLGAHFCYEAQPANGTHPSAGDRAMYSLDPIWRDQLRQAAVEANVTQMYALIDQIKVSYPDLATQMATWIDDFAYETLLAWLEIPGSESL
ncbi:PAS domain S-box protein [Candidatus Chloroploca sp. Khr17]|uniref:PAS domain S-box protein n=1 Tax=Candidatus Chloroploca sp. Khr17 TaxID=2496869 RepID=UPI00101BA0C3|nr:PAS domain S-box protein [Candidatus Chloroploca sp. Khr17]